MRRMPASALALACVTSLSAVVLPSSGEADAASTPVAAVADGYVTSASPMRTFGTTTALRIDTEPETMRTYLRFDLRNVAGSVTRATLRLHAGSGSMAGYRVHAVADTGWTETTLSFAKAPSPGAEVGRSGRFAAGSWTSVDVTSAVAAGRPVTFAVTGIDSAAVRFDSRESGATGPQLLLEFGSRPGSSTTTAPTTSTSTTSTSTTSTSTTSTSTTSTTTTTTTTPPPPTSTTTPPVTTPPDVQPSFPIRAAFYYPWFPESWKQSGVYPYTNYEPSLGYYDGADPAVVRSHIEAMQYGNIAAGISSWWGQGHRTDTRLTTLLRAADGTSFRWAVYYEPEAQGDPTVATITSDLTHLAGVLANDPSALRVDGRFVVFVYADGQDGCGMADRWRAANTVGAYVVLKVFPGYAKCASQPDGWHQYGPASAASDHAPWSYSVSPGFWKKGESPRLERNLDQWRSVIRAMVDSNANFQLVTTFNEWGEGTAVESGTTWASPSGYGAYLDALHDNGAVPTNPPETNPPTNPPPAADPRIAAAGDIACDPASGSFKGGAGTSTSCRQMATSDLLVANGYDAVLPLGDIQYEAGAAAAFAQSYDPSWGRVKAVTHPVVGNHEYGTPGAAAYYEYFGAAAGDPAKGYYSYDLGSWHVVALNSNCGEVSCRAGFAQEQWLRADLAAHPAQCSLVYWHHPRWSSGEHGPTSSVAPLYQAAYDAGVDIVLSGHDHHYERFAPQAPNGALDTARGIRQFVVGTGGKSHYAATTPQPNSEVTNTTTYGVLELTLHATSYDWRFVPAAGGTFTDSGSAACT